MKLTRLGGLREAHVHDDETGTVTLIVRRSWRDVRYPVEVCTPTDGGIWCVPISKEEALELADALREMVK